MVIKKRQVQSIRFGRMWWLWKEPLVCSQERTSGLLWAGVLGHGLGTLADGVLGQLTGQQQTHSSLDFAAGDGRPAVVVSKTGRLGSDSLEDVVDERIHDAHGLAADASVRVNLFQHLVDVDGVALPPPLVPLLRTTTGGLCLGGGLLRSLRRCFGSHDANDENAALTCATLL